MQNDKRITENLFDRNYDQAMPNWSNYKLRYFNMFVSRHRYFLLSSLIILLIIFQIFYGKWVGDFWEHSAVIRTLTQNLFSPLHPQLLINAPHVFYTPYALLVAAIARNIQIDPISILSIFAIFNVTILLIFFRKFLLLLNENEKYPFYALFLSLILWGPRPWAYSGFYHLEVLPYISPYPATFAMAITFLILYCYSLFLKTNKLIYYIILLPLSSIVLITHPITAIFLFVGIIAITISADIKAINKIICASLTIVISFVFAFFWPYFPFSKLINISVFDAYNYPMYRHIFKQTYPILFGIPLLIQRIRLNKRDILSLMFIGLCLVYVYGWLSGKYSYGRVISFIVLTFDFIIADFLARNQLKEYFRSTNIFKQIGSYSAVVFIVVLSVMHLKPLLKTLYHDNIDKNISSQFSFLPKFTQENAVIMSDLNTSWYIPTFGNKIVASLHPLAFISDEKERRNAVERFFGESCPQEMRLAIINKYRVNYILINFNRKISPETIESISRLGDLIYENRNYRLIKLPTPMRGNHHPDPEPDAR